MIWSAQIAAGMEPEEPDKNSLRATMVMSIGAVSALFMLAPAIATRRVEDAVFLVNPASDGLYHLDGVGAALWEMMDRPLAVDTAVELLAEVFADAGREKIAGDVQALLADLALHRLVERLE